MWGCFRRAHRGPFVPGRDEPPGESGDSPETGGTPGISAVSCHGGPRSRGRGPVEHWIGSTGDFRPFAYFGVPRSLGKL